MCKFCDSSPGYEKTDDATDIRIYDQVESREKHKPVSDEAKIIWHKTHWRGKCPGNMSPETAHQLLNSGIPEFRKGESDRPYSIWNFHDGIIYRARHNNVGNAWHGYPTCQGVDQVPGHIERKLRERAKDQGFGNAQFNRWYKQKLDRSK